MHGMIGSTTTQPLIPASYPIGRAWYVAICHPQQEPVAVEYARERGYDAFTPMAVTVRVVRGKRVRRRLPLFRGYIFVCLDIEADGWGELIEDIGRPSGIRELLPTTGIPLSVNALVIDRLRRAEEAGAFDFSAPSSTFSEGDQVEIKEGPFAGIIALVRSASAHKRVKVLLEKMGTIDIDACFLERKR